MGYSSTYNSPKTDSYNSPKSGSYNSPKPEAYESQRPTVVNGMRDGVGYSYELPSKSNNSLKNVRNLIMAYLDLLEIIAKEEVKLENLKKQQQELEEKIKNDPEARNILSVLGNLDNEKKGKSF